MRGCWVVLGFFQLAASSFSWLKFVNELKILSTRLRYCLGKTVLISSTSAVAQAMLFIAFTGSEKIVFIKFLIMQFQHPSGSSPDLQPKNCLWFVQP
jgi:hypothetical protein